MTLRRAFLVAGAAVVVPFVLLQLYAPSYLFHLGFPLDDAWIHAVYARSFAQHGMLAYNPGIPANGETSPLWAVLTAWPYVLTGRTAVDVALVKLTGLLLHAGTALLAWVLARRLRASALLAATSALLVAFHPDLIAASVSGMEVPLATLLALWAILEGLDGPSWRLALVCFLTPLGRPEVASVPVIFFALCAIVEREGRFLRAAAIALVSSLASFGLMAYRNLHITGRPLPATFYAKVTWPGSSWMGVQWAGFTELIGRFAVAGSLLLLVLLTAVALWLMLQRVRAQQSDPRLDGDTKAAMVFLTGMVFFSLSFTLIPPVDPPAFYHQRYALPGLLLVLFSMPMLIDVVLRALPDIRFARYARYGVVVALGALIALPLPNRLRHLANDARNIDDVQVAEGKSLANQSPAAVVWAVDAGAIRYFGNAFVVDAMGLNSPDLLGANAQTFLNAHPAQYLSFVQGWTRLDTSPPQQMAGTVFRPSTPYTVTSVQMMAAHYLIRCAPSLRGRYSIVQRAFDLACAEK